MIEEVLVVVFLLLAIPIGYLLAWLCRDEIALQRNWYRTIIGVSGIAIMFFIFIKNYVIVLTFAFILIITLVSLIKSYDKKFVKKRLS